MASLGLNIIVNYVGRIWTTSLSILFIPFYLKFIGIEAYGLVGFYTTLSSVIGILDLGIGATMNRELARLSVKDDSAGPQRDMVRTLELIYWGIAILAGGLVFLVAPYFAQHWIKTQSLNPGLVLKSLRIMGFAVALQFPVSLYRGGLMGMQSQVLVNGILVLTGTLRSVGAIFVLWLVSPTIDAFFGWQVVSSIVGILIFFVAMWSSLPKHVEKAKFRFALLYDVWKYAAAISGNAIIGVVLTQLDKVILSRMLTLKMFGYYSLAATVASAIWMIIIPFNTAVFPYFVQLHEMKLNQDIRVLFHRSSQLLSIILIPVCSILIVFSREILFLWMHDPLVVENCYLIVCFLVLGTMLNGIASIPANSVSAFGWPQLITYTNVIQAVVIIPLIVGMVKCYQGVGAAIAWSILNCTFIVFMVPIFFRRYLTDECGRWYMYDVTAPLFSSFFVCIMSKLIAPPMNSRITIFCWLAFTGVASIIITGFILKHVRCFIFSILGVKLNNLCNNSHH